MSDKALPGALETALEVISEADIKICFPHYGYCDS
jgi:hypothetical protein